MWNFSLPIVPKDHSRFSRPHFNPDEITFGSCIVPLMARQIFQNNKKLNRKLKIWFSKRSYFVNSKIEHSRNRTKCIKIFKSHLPIINNSFKGVRMKKVPDKYKTTINNPVRVFSEPDGFFGSVDPWSKSRW